MTTNNQRDPSIILMEIEDDAADTTRRYDCIRELVTTLAGNGNDAFSVAMYAQRIGATKLIAKSDFLKAVGQSSRKANGVDVPTDTEIGREYVKLHCDDTMYSRSQWHRYQDGVWKVIPDTLVNQEIWDLLERYEHASKLRPTANLHRSVCKYAQDQLSVLEELLDANPDWINMTNGVYDVAQRKLLPHNSKFYLTNQLPFDYDPYADAPTWERYLNTTFIFKDSGEADTDLIAFVQQAIGYSLTLDVRYHVSFWCHGARGNNGKGVLFHVIEKLAGTSATSLDVNSLRKERYQLADLAGKRIALCTEANATDNLVEDAVIKQLVAGDTMKARQIHREPFDLHPKVKLWWSMNNPPTVADTSNGFWRRVRMIPFHKEFVGAEIDFELKEKLDKELPGIFIWAIQGLLSLRSVGTFITPQQVLDETAEYKRESNVVGLFVEECCVKESGKECLKSQLYARYKEWAVINTYKPLSNRSLKRELSNLNIYSKHTNIGDVYEGITLKSTLL